MTDKILYTAHSASKGGRNGHSGTTDGKLSFDLATPGAPNAKPGTTNPEELFACGYAACFGGAVDYIARQQKVDASNAEVKADVSLIQGEGGFSIGVVLNVSIPGLDKAVAEKLIHDAHEMCPYSKATRGNINVELKIA